MNKKNKTLLIQLGLLLLSIVTTTLAGAEWMHSKYLFWVDDAHRMTFDDFVEGFQFSIPFLLILTVHEFGHFFTAKFHKVKVTLPYYIPLWLGFILAPSFGTMGAFIKIKDIIRTRLHYFDIGVAGPIAGFIVALFVIHYGYNNLPDPESIYEIHPEYEQFGLDYPSHVYSYDFSKSQHYDSYLEMRRLDSIEHRGLAKEDAWSYPKFEPMENYPSMYFSKPLLFHLAETYWVPDQDKAKIPNKQEIMHNPYLLAGLLALFFTALNLLPIGQLDGGHVIFGLFGSKKARKVSLILFTSFLFYAGLGVVNVSLMNDTSIMGLLSFLLIIVAYMYFLYMCGFSAFDNKRDRMLYAAIIFAAQFAVHTFLGIEGYSGYLLFALLLGRFVGIYHPEVPDNKPLNNGRIAIGLFAILVFILSFSPEPFVLG